MAGSIEVKGLKQARENLFKLSEEVGVKITRAALLEAGLVINRALKAATYTTFNRKTGRIQAGFGVRVGMAPKDEVLSAVVVQYPRPLAAGPRLKSAAKQERGGVAYWWRFLEFGTFLRKSVRTPRTKQVKSLRPGTRSAKAWARWQSAPSRGRIEPREWIRPTFTHEVEAAVERFAREFRRTTEDEVNKLPK